MWRWPTTPIGTGRRAMSRRRTAASRDAVDS